MSAQARTYGEGCIAAHALDLVGDRWTLLVARELMLGPKRFGALQAGLPGIATNMLTRRLADMEAAGLLTRRAAAAPVSATVYALTEAGEALWPVLAALCQLGRRLPGHDPRLPISPTSLMLSLRCTLLPERAVEGDRSAGFDLAGESFAVTVTGGRHHVERADPPRGEVIFRGRPNDVAVALYGPAPLTALPPGLVGIEGDLARAQGFADLFRLQPPPAAG